MTNHLASFPDQPAGSADMLDALQRDAFSYFLHETNPANGLVADKTQQDAHTSSRGYAARDLQMAGYEETKRCLIGGCAVASITPWNVGSAFLLVGGLHSP